MMNEQVTCRGCAEYVELERRQFLDRCARIGALAMLSAPAWFPRLAFASDPENLHDTIICIFLRGGADGLTLCVPYGDADYYVARNVIAVPPPDSAAPLKAVDLNGFFGLAPGVATLLPIYSAGHLAFVHACGSPDSSRSHFQAQDSMESGTLEISGNSTGWLARHLLTVPAMGNGLLRGVGASVTIPKSLAGAAATIPIPDIDNYDLVGQPVTKAARQALLSTMYASAGTFLQVHAENVAATLDLITQVNANGYTPAGGAVYPEGPWGIGLRTIAQLTKADIGLEVACIDLHGWDTHAEQGTLDGKLHALMSTLSEGLVALYTDLTECLNRVTVVVLSEFGRRVEENASAGCDHGHGNAMMVMGGNVNGGQVIAEWPGLHPDVLDQGRDLAITIDYRDVLGEILQKRAGNTSLDTVFPGYTPVFQNVVV